MPATAGTSGVIPYLFRTSDSDDLEECMSPTAAELMKADQEHLIHSPHHPVDNAQTCIYVRGHGVTVQDIDGTSTSMGFLASGT